MSFMSRLRKTTPDAADLSGLEPLLRRAPVWKNNKEKEEFLRLHLQMRETHQKVLQSLKRFEQAQSEEQIELSQLKDELATYVEALKKSSMKFFRRGQYQECYEVLTLLVEIEPDSQAARDFLEIARQKILEGRDGHYSGADEFDPAVSGEMGDVLTDDGQISHPIPSGLLTPAESGAKGPKPRSRRYWLALAFTGLLLLATFVGERIRLKSEPISTTTFEIQSDPDLANVFMNGLLVGKTQLKLNSIEPGSYSLRLEKEGYVPLARPLVIEKGEPSIISVRLGKLEVNPNSLVGLREKAQALFDLGDLAEAGLICNTILERDPQDSLALKLKENIHNYYFAPMVQERADSSAETRLPEVSQSKLRGGQADSILSKQSLDPVKEAAPPRNNTQSEAQKLTQAASPVQFVNPNPPQTIPSPAKQSGGPISNPPSIPRLDSPGQDLASQIQARIQAKEFDQARNLLAQIQNIPSAQADWKSLTEKLRAEEARQQNLVLPWVQKAESALILARYVTPPDDNVVLYCNRALAADPQNPRVLALKKDVVGRSVVQAREWIDRGRFDEARLFYSSLYYLSHNDSRFPIPGQELRQELTKLEFSSYPVIHEHKLGSCRGRLRINGYVVSFVPSEDSAEGFTEKLKNVSLVEADNDLRLRVNDKSYRFQPNVGQGKKASQEAAKPMYEKLIKLLSPKR